MTESPRNTGAVSRPAQNPGLAKVMLAVADRARRAGVFGGVAEGQGWVECEAKASAAPAFFRAGVEDGKLWVSLVTADRWLSQSIEADLVHTGDKLEELLFEELVDLGYKGRELKFEHFRSEEKLFTFRSAPPVDVMAVKEGDAEMVAACLLGYEACFRRLGDMEVKEE